MKNIFRITWLDPTTYTCEEVKSPFKNYFTETVSIGEVRECSDDPNIIVIISCENADDAERDFTVIHKSLVVKTEELKGDDVNVCP